MLSIRLTILAIVINLSAQSQGALLSLEWYERQRLENACRDSADIIFPEIRPLSRFDVARTDSVNATELKKLAWVSGSNVLIKPYPVVSGVGIGGKGVQRQGTESYLGTGITFSIGKRMYADASYLRGYTEPLPFMNAISDSLGVVSGYGRAIKQGGNAFEQFSTGIGFKASKHVNVYAGRGKHFIGEGYRSVLLSDYAPNYNYLRADARVWRLKYMVLYAQMNNIEGYPQRFGSKSKKYSTIHYLSANVTSWWNVGFFESVVWEHEDSVQKRGFDMHYLNPVIFFRPVEYSMGSSDNSLMGIQSTLRPAHSITLYGQVMVDELLIKDYLAPLLNRFTDTAIATGNWVNKQAYQAGFKYHEPMGWKKASVLAEINWARPFTFGHSNPRQSYTHLNQSLAHPLGSNFIEWVYLMQWQPKRWILGLRSTYSRKGFTNSSYFLGEDPLISNTERDINGRITGNFLLQGKRIDTGNIRLEVGYTLVEAWSLRLEGAVQHRIIRSHLNSDNAFYFLFGLRTALWNDYRDL